MESDLWILLDLHRIQCLPAGATTQWSSLAAPESLEFTPLTGAQLGGHVPGAGDTGCLVIVVLILFRGYPQVVLQADFWLFTESSILEKS